VTQARTLHDDCRGVPGRQRAADGRSEPAAQRCARQRSCARSAGREALGERGEPELAPAGASEPTGSPRLQLALPSGLACVLVEPRLPGLPGYRVLALKAPSRGDEDVVALLACAERLARRLARERLGDPQCYTLLFNGAGTRRRGLPHVHIILARGVREKRWALLCLALKRVLRWFRRGPAPADEP